MNKWVVEDWKFELTAVEGKAGNCRLGLEKGDTFSFSYECPAGMCPRVMMQVYTWCEVIRCVGDFTYRGEREKYEMDYEEDYWVMLEEFFKLISNKNDIFYGTNKEILL